MFNFEVQTSTLSLALTSKICKIIALLDENYENIERILAVQSVSRFCGESSLFEKMGHCP